MIKLLKSSFYFLILQTLFINSVYSSPRTDSLLFEDASLALDTLQEQKDDIKKFKNDLAKIDLHLKESKKGQSIYLKFNTIAGVTVAVAIIIGSYKAHFPPGFRAMVSAYTTVTGASHGLIKISEKDTKIFLTQVNLLNQKAIAANAKIDKQIQYYCKIYDNHELCN